MNRFLAGLLIALAAAQTLAAATNLSLPPTGAAVVATATNIEAEFQKLLADDDAAQAEVDKWIRDNNEFAARGASVPKEELNRRILSRFEPVRKSYEAFLQRHPNHARARLAYASFLEDIQDEPAAVVQMEKSLELDPKNPAVWNNLANYYAHEGPVTNAFDYYAKAIELNSNESLYYENYGTTVFLFRRDAMDHFHLTEPQVFDKAMALYARALKLDPDNFTLATEVARSYYEIKPLRTNDALAAWTNALQLAHGDLEREGIQLHLARVKVMAGLFDEARAHLDAVTNETYAELKRRITRTLAENESARNPTSAAIVSTNSTSATTNSGHP